MSVTRNKTKDNILNSILGVELYFKFEYISSKILLQADPILGT